MKRIFYAFIVAMVSLAGCNSESEKSEESVTGIYVQEINNEFARGSDSLIITVLDKSAGTYSIVNNYGFMRYLDGQEKGRDHTTQKFTAVYVSDKKQLVDNFKATVFTLVPEKGLLLKGGTTYRKVK